MTIAQLINDSDSISILTGAGVSVDSGIPDFKSIDSNWNHSIPRHEAISIQFFQRNPLKFWELYRELFESKDNAKPNDFHKYLANLEAAHEVTIATQNVDGLHTAAGSSSVLEIHGSVDRVICSRKSCSAVYPARQFKYIALPKCLKCLKVLKPDVCLFGEGISYFDIASQAVLNSDLLIVAGTSLDVSPVNLLPLVAENYGINRLWVNKTAAPKEFAFTHQFIGTLEDFLQTVA